VTLHDLAELLRGYAQCEVPLAIVHERLRTVLAADPLDVSASDATRWDAAPDEERLFWRLVYLVDSSDDDTEELRAAAGTVVDALRDTGSAVVTHELLPLLLDRSRLVGIIEKHRAGIITRTGFLSVVAESGYPAHIKLWLEHATPAALGRLADRLDAGQYGAVVTAFEARPE
jgi:hypothetical protein